MLKKLFVILLLLAIPAISAPKPLLALVDSHDSQHRFTLERDGNYKLDFGVGGAQFSGKAEIAANGFSINIKNKTATHEILGMGDAVNQTGFVKVTQANGVIYALFDTTKN